MKKHALRLFCALLALLLLAGCSKAADYNDVYTEAPNMVPTMPAAEIWEDSSSSLAVTPAAPVATDRKIIVNYTLRTETLEFDALLEKLNAKIRALGGYVESSSVDYTGSSRYANMTVRVPSQLGESFTDYISENSHVLSTGVDTSDVTLTYVDIQSRLDAYRAEKAQLEELMKQAKDLTEVITVQNRLTEVIYEIEALESRLRTYDNLVDYATVSLTVREVEKETVVEKQTVWQRIGTNLSEGFANVGELLTDLFVAGISALPYLITLACFGGAVAVIVLLCTRSRKKKAQKENG